MEQFFSITCSYFHIFKNSIVDILRYPYKSDIRLASLPNESVKLKELYIKY